MRLEQEMTVGWESYALAKSQLNVMLLDKLYSRITINTAVSRCHIPAALPTTVTISLSNR